MRKSLFILIILFLSCDSVEETGLPEYEGGFNYYDYIAYGWSEFLNENYDNAISYFQQALLIDDVNEDGISDYMHHSAYVGISWSLTYQANELINTNDNSVSIKREEAITYLCYFMDESNEWVQGDCLFDEEAIENSDLNAFSFYNSDDMYTSCFGEYCCNDCFINDKKVAMIYFYSFKYHDFFIQDDLVNASLYFDKAIELGLDFISSNQLITNLDKNIDYDFMNGKPIENPIFNLKYQNVLILLGQLYLKNGNYENAALILSDVCNNINAFEVQTIIDCVQSF